MIELKRKIYKDIEITFEVDKNGLFISSAPGISRCYANASLGSGYTTFASAEEAIIKKINEFLDDVPKNYEELAHKVEKSLVWTGYEDCHVDETILKTIIQNFIKYTIKT